MASSRRVLALAAVVVLALPAAALAVRKRDRAAPLAPPTNVAVAGTTPTSVTLAWRASSSSGVSGYQLFRSGVAVATTTGTSATWSGLSCDGAYRLSVQAYGPGGAASRRVDVNVTTPACASPAPPAPPAGLAPPANLHVVAATPTSVTLSWSASAGAASYQLLRSGVQLATTAGTTATWRGLNCNGLYRFSVVAAAASGRTSDRVDLSTTTGACPAGAAAPQPAPATSVAAAPPAAAPGGTLFVAPQGSDAGTCTQAAPCASFERAYELASRMQTVLVAGGRYGGQTLGPARKSGSGVVLFRPAPGASIMIDGELRIAGANDLEFDGLTTSDWYVDAGSDNVTFRNVTTQSFFVRSASNVDVLGGSVGGSSNAVSPTVGAAYESTVPTTNMVIDGVAFHDVTRAANPSDHVECLFVQSVDGFVLRNSTFTHCDVFDVYVNNILNGPVPKNVLIDHNTFADSTDGGFYSLFVRNDPGDTIRGLTIRSNTFQQGFHLDAGNYVDTHVTENTGPLTPPQCTAGIDWSGNSFTGARCGPTDN